MEKKFTSNACVIKQLFPPAHCDSFFAFEFQRSLAFGWHIALISSGDLSLISTWKCETDGMLCRTTVFLNHSISLRGTPNCLVK